MEILSKIGYTPEQIAEVNSKLTELGINEAGAAYINSLATGIESTAASTGYRNAMEQVEDSFSTATGLVNADKKKTTDFLLESIKGKESSYSEQLNAAKLEFESKLKDKGLDKAAIEAEAEAKFNGKITAYSTELEELRGKVGSYEQEKITNENKAIISKFLLPIDETDELAVELRNDFVDNLLKSTNEITDDGYFKGETGVLVSIKEKMRTDKRLSRFVNDAGQERRTVEKGRIIVKNVQGAGTNQFSHLEGQEKMNAIESHVKKEDPSTVKNAIALKRAMAKYM